MRKPSRRRRTDQADPLDRLTQAERAELKLLRLSTEVSAACVAWLTARGVPSAAWREPIAATAATGPTAAMPDDHSPTYAPRGRVQTLEGIASGPNESNNFHACKINLFWVTYS